MSPPDKRSQVGMATHLSDRLAKRRKATCKSRFGRDCIPWYHDLLRSHSAVEIVLEAIPCDIRADAMPASGRSVNERGPVGGT